MAKNVIIMIGDGMGWEMARAAAIYEQIKAGATGTTLSDFYTEGKGEGLSFQNLSEYALATTYGTTIAPPNGIFSTSNSALDNSDPDTGESPVLPGFTFDPTFNPGTTSTGGAPNPNNFAVGNLVGYDPVQGGAVPWDAAYYGGTAPEGFNPEYIKYSYPDSANTATTLYTGVKSYNNAIGVDIFEQSLESILARATDLDKSTGLVSSVPIDHATPGAAAANVNRRNKYDSDYPILESILQQELRVYQPTVMLGGGHPLTGASTMPLPGGVEPNDYTYIRPSTYEELSENPTDNIYDYTFLERGTDAAQVLLETAAEIDPNSGDRLFGLYGARGQEGNLPVSSADGDYSTTGLSMFSRFSTQGLNPDTMRPLLPGETDEEFIAREINENPTLKDLTNAALTVLEKDPDGFWLMIEGGDIDWAAHDNNLDNLLGTMQDFNESVQTTIDWIGNNGGWEENLLIVTADHDHYLTLNENFPELLRTIGPEAMTEALNPAEAGHFWGSDPNLKYGWGNHTNRPVPVYYQGDGAPVLTDTIGEGFEQYGEAVPGIAGLTDQTHIYTTMAAAFASELVIDGKTDANPYVFNLPDINPVTGENPEYDIIPLLTVGDEVPLLEGEFGDFTVSLTDTYAMAGIPDGLGFTQIGDLYYVFMNHELGSSVVTDVSSTVNGQINGARVSLYVFDQNWDAIGGKNLIEDVVIDGITYSLNLTTGNYEDASGSILNMTDHNNFDRFCSAYLATQGFVDENGNEIPIYFAPEEVDAGLGIPITPDGTALPLRGLGTFSKEQVFAASQYRATNSDYTALISTEDDGDGEIYLYIGKQSADNPNGFTSNPDEFNLYVLQVVDPTTGTVYGFEAMPENVELVSRWQLVPDDVALSADPAVLSNWVNATDASGMFRSTDFERPEDVHEDFNNPGTFYFATTGTEEIPPGSTEAVNRFGMLHRFNLQLDANGIPLDGTFEFLMEGGPNTGVSYDNLVVDSNGNVVINEDRTAGGGEIMDAQQRNGRVVSYNIALNENRVGTDEVTFLFELDQAAEGEQFDTGFGAWETSGIIEVPGGTNGQSAYLFDVQAGTIRNDSGVYEGRYERGGQLILVVPTEESAASPKIVGFSSLPADTFAPGLPGGSGNAITSPDRTTPFEGQPVQGFSGVQFADDGSYWFLSDNGFGAKANSADYLLRVYKVDPNFKTEDGGTGEADWTDFIQLSDPNNLIEWDIVQEETTERLLTGADFDPESIVLAEDGTIWIGEEFGPYLLHFDSNGVLIDAPVATPNLFNFNTLSGEDPLVIAHRGASGDRPEHTLGFLGRDLIAAYNLAIEMGADFIEPDLVPTKDGVLIARHENALAIVKTDVNGNPIIKDNGEYDITEATTNVYLLPQFAERLTTKVIDGTTYTGWFSEDFTLAEIKQLRAVERIPGIRPDNTEYDFLFEIPTLGEIIDLVKFIEQTTGEKIGIYPETKHPTYFAEEGTFLDGTPININTSQILIDTLVEKGFTDPDRIFIQSFEVGNLKELNETIMPAAGVDIPLVQLLNSSGQPYDFVVSGDARTYADLATPQGLAEIATYAEGIGSNKRLIVPATNNNLQSSTTLVEDAHAAGLIVHAWTFRDEDVFLANNYNSNPALEYDQFYSLGIDGLFSDNPDTALEVLADITAPFVRSPDNPQGTDLVNLGRSRGFEGMASSPDGMTLYPLLEGRVTGDPANALRIYEFDVASKTYADELVGYYQLAEDDHAIGDFTPINDNEFLVIERDNLQGTAAQFKRVFKVDFSEIDSNGFVEKTLLVDLLNLADPDDLNSDGSLVYTMPFQTIEDILVIDEKTILLANDNNYPFSKGRPPALDNNEIVLIELPEALDLAPELGLPEVSLSATPATVEEGSQLTWNFTLAQPVPTGGLVLNLDLTQDTDPLPGDIQYNVTGSENITAFELVVEGGVIQGAKVTLAEGATSAKLVSNIIADEKTEGSESITFTLVQGEGYRISTDTNEASFTISDTSQIPKTVFGSPGDDTFDTIDPDEKNFVGDNQVLILGPGDDLVDVTLAVGSNRLTLGSGDDIAFAGTNNRIYAGPGDDLIFLGTGGGKNLITGGLGADQFWIVTDEGDLPTVSNTITDFNVSDGDVIGFGATSLDFDALNLTQAGSNTIINALGKDLAILQNIQAASLSADNFVFA